MLDNDENLYLFGDFSFDAGVGVLLRGDEKPAQLAPKIAELLQIMIKNRGRISAQVDESNCSRIISSSFFYL